MLSPLFLVLYLTAATLQVPYLLTPTGPLLMLCRGAGGAPPPRGQPHGAQHVGAGSGPRQQGGHTFTLQSMSGQQYILTKPQEYNLDWDVKV